MFIEIIGTQFVNKGAELMLISILNKVREKYPDVKIVMTPSSRKDFLQRSNLKLYQKLEINRFRIRWRIIENLIPSLFCEKYGLIKDNQIDIVLDASGFAYSDQWGDYPAKILSNNVKKWKKRNTKIILLPQALGPFSKSKIKKYISYIGNNIDLIFPRDIISYRNITSLIGEQDKIIQSPDFTNITKCMKPSNEKKYKDKFCFIPNFRMIDKMSKDDQSKYLSFSTKCIQILDQIGEDVFILVHEGDKDRNLAKRIIEMSKCEVDIYKEIDPLIIKGILGISKGVISSRYHGLISALSQNVPSMAVGWSHKYEMLFNEYDIPENYLSLDLTEEELKDILKRFVLEERRLEMIERISKKSVQYKERTVNMWERVFAIIDGKDP